VQQIAEFDFTSSPLLQVKFIWLIPLSIMGIDLRYRSIDQRRRAEEAALAAATTECRVAAKLEGLGGSAPSTPQVGD